ncbi:hypothetical protein EDB86DRAFT_895498 [Lactarius hatsudake]|nr:hypothetical protein EDB86DRAFT_895498 [Lactarius hatsudake]
MVESSGSPTTSPDIISVATPLLFGVVFNWTLFGVLCVQIYVYSYNFRTDRRFVKFLVYFVFLLETIQTCPDWSRYLLLVCFRIWQCRTLREFPFLSR